MDNTFTLGKRVFSAAIAAATILWAVGIAAFAVPQTASAASGGDVIKGTSLTTTYYYGYDGSRYTFPNEKTYMTWFDDFNGVETISDSALADIDLAGNVVYRPGSRWIKITSDPKTYAVSTNGMIHWVESETVANDFDGSDWNTNIDDVADTFFVDYTAGTSLMDASAFDGMMYMDGSDYYLSWGGEKRMVSSAGRSANNMDSDFFLDGSGIDDSSLTSGSTISSVLCDLIDAAQTGCDDTSVATGDVMVSLNSSTPAGATLPLGANSVEVLSFDLEAGDEDANVNIVALTMDGIGATTNVSNVYLYEGNMRLTEARSVNASTRKATFGSLDLDIEAGETRTLTARVEVSSSGSAGDEIAFSIKEEGDVTTDGGDVDGSFPVSGNDFTLAATSAGSVTVTKNGTITNPNLGAQDATIGQFKVAANTEDAWVDQMTLKIDSASDHDDFRLWDGSDELASGEYIGDKLVAFDLSADPFYIEEGGNNIFKVTADVGGDASDAIKVYVDNSVDVVALGGDFGFGMSVDIATSGTYDGSSCTSSSGNCSYSTVAAGDVTFAFNGPAAGDIRTNSQDQTLLEFSLTAAQSITVKDLDIILYADDDADNDPFDAVDDEDSDDSDDGGTQDATGDNDGLVNESDEANLTDIKIVNVDTGTVIMGPLELDSVAASADDADQTIDFTDDFGMDAGETLNLAVTVDVDDQIGSGETNTTVEVGATIDISGFVAEDANGDTITNATNVVPSTDIPGYIQQTNSASLVVSLASTPGSTTAVQGKSAHLSNAFNLVSGDSGAVNISSITMTVYADDDGSGTFTLGDVSGADVNDFISSCSIYNKAGDLLDGPTSPESDGTNIIFSDVVWTIEESTSELMSIKCNLANPSDTDSDYFAFDIADVSEDIVAEDDDGTDVDPTGDAANGGTSPTNVVTIAAQGSIAVTVDSSSPSADFVLAGTDDNHVATLRFTATSEDFTVKRITLTEEAAQDDNGTTDSNAYANNIEQMTIEYTNSAGATATKTASMSGNEALFTGLDMLVEVGSPAKVKAYVDVPPTDRDAGGSATSNEKIEIGFSVDASADDQFESIGVDSGVTRDDDNVSAVETEKQFVVKETAPTITLSSSSPSGTGFVPGDQEVLRFNVAANSAEDVILDEMVFSFSATDNDGTEGTTDNQPDWNECDSNVSSGYGIYASMLDLYDLSDDGLASALDVDADWTILVNDGTNTYADCGTSQYDVTGFQMELTTSKTIPAGETHVFVLYFDSSRANATNDDSMQVGIPADLISPSSDFIDTTTINEGAAFAVTDTTLTVTSGTAFTAGDVICLTTGTCAAGDEKALVTAKSTNDLTIVRGYMGSAPASIADGSNVDRLPSTFYWEDDGDGSTDNTGDNWGSYLIDSLPVNGGAIGF